MASKTNLNKKRSDIWNHYTLIAHNVAKCNYCNEKKRFSGGSTGNLTRHIKTRHVTVPLHRTIMVSEGNSENIDNPQPLSLNPISQTHPPGNSLIQTTASPSINIHNQLAITNFIQRPLPLSKSKSIDQQLIRMIVKEYHPFSVVEDKEFRKLINLLSPSYIIPSRKTISNSIMPQMYKMVVEKVKEQLKNVTAVCLTTDGWTSRNNQSFVAVTAHFINPENDTELSAYLLGCTSFPDSHTADNLALFLKNTVSEWGLNDRVTAVVTDNASNMKLAIDKCDWRRISCFAHSVNLVVQSSLEIIEPVITKVKNIVSYFKRSSHALAKLEEYQKQTGSPILKLKQDCPTRWNSCYDMLERVLKLREPIIATLAILNNNHLNSLNSYDWEIIEKSKDLLKIFYDITIEISAEKHVTISKEIIFVNALLKYTANFVDEISLPKEVHNMAEILRKKLLIRFGSIEDNLLIGQATLLDPRFKSHAFSNTDSYESISAEPVSSSSAIWADFDKTVNHIVGGNNSTAASIIEMDKYLNEPLIKRHENPLLWWSERKKVYPRLYEIVKRRLCIVATSVPCERLFSKAGQVVTDRRNRENVICLKYTFVKNCGTLRQSVKKNKKLK